MSRKQKATELVETVKSLMESDTGLRKSQIKALHQFTDREEAPYRGIFNLATGVGKTRVMSMLALAHLQNNPDSQIVVGIPSMELFQQEMDAFQDYKDFQDKQRKRLKYPALSIPEHLDMGAFNQFKKDTTSQIIFTTYQSLEKLSQRMDTSKVGLLLLDEAHHVVSEKRSNAVNTFTNAIHYGMTATPWYSPERNAENVLGEILAKVDIVDAIKETALAEFKNVLMVSNLSVDLSKVAKDKITGDYKEEDFCKAILQAMRGNSANSGNEENWKEAHHYIAKEVAKFYHDYIDEHVGTLNGKKCLINCRSQEEARIQAQELNKLFGHMVARVHTSDECDSQTIQDFVDGDLPIVCQVGKLTEGFDMPNLDMTINYPTASFVREAQGAARCIRLPKTKDPKIPPKKMGLVVDIAFKHPEYNNIVDAIRHNKQILFQDIVGIPFVQHDDEELQLEEMPEEELRNLGGGRGVSPVGRVSFTIISNARELIRLTREAKKIEEERAQEEAKLRDGFTSGNVAKILGIKIDTARNLIDRYEGKKIINPETGKEEACTKMMKNSVGSPCLGLTRLGFKKVLKDWEEEHKGYTSTDIAKELNISQTTAGSLIAHYKGKKILNSETGEEEACTKMMKNSAGLPCLGLTKIGFEKAIKDWEEEHEGVVLCEVAKKMGINKATARKLIDHYEGKKVINPETGEEEDCTKMVTPLTGKPTLGFTKLGFEKALKDWKEEHEGVSLTEVVKKIGICQNAARKLIDSYEGKKIINPETGEEEACTKMMKNSTGLPCLGFTRLGFEKALKDREEEQKVIALIVVAKKIGISKDTARKLINRYEGKIVINPETGEEEACTKMMKNSAGLPCLGLTRLGFKKVLKDWEKEHEGVTLNKVIEQMGISEPTARKLIDSYEGKKIINPETGEEEPCTKMVTPPTGRPSLGFTKLGWKLVLKEYKKKQERTTSSTLRPRLKAGSAKGQQKAPSPRKPVTPEI